MRKTTCFGIAVIILFCISAYVLAISAPSSVDFGTIVAGSGDAIQTVNIGNDGSQPLTISGCSITAPFLAPLEVFTLTPGGQRPILITLRSTHPPAVYNGAFRCNFNGGSFTTTLRGIIVDLISANPTALNFGNVAAGQAKTLELTLRNNLSGSLTSIAVVSIRIAASPGTLPNTFVASKTALKINAGRADVVQVTMNAGNISGAKSGTLAIDFASIGSPVKKTINIPLEGTVVTN